MAGKKYKTIFYNIDKSFSFKQHYYVELPHLKWVDFEKLDLTY